MIGDVEHQTVRVLVLGLGVNPGDIVRQFHEKFAAEFNRFFSGFDLVVHYETHVMQSGPVGAVLPALGAFGEMKQGQIHRAVRQHDRVAVIAFDIADAVQFE